MPYTDIDSQEALGHCMGRTTRAMGKLLQNNFFKAGFDITFEQWTIIVNLMRCNGQFQQQLADNTYKDKASITRMVDTLQSLGIVDRITDTSDLRQKKVFLAEKGRKLYKQLLPFAQKVQKKSTRDIKPEDLELCKNILVKIYKNITTD